MPNHVHTSALGLLAQPWLLDARHAPVLERVARSRLGLGTGGAGSKCENADALSVAVELRGAKAAKQREHWCGSLGGIVDGVDLDSSGELSERDMQRGFAVTRSGRTAIVPVHGLLVRHASMVNGVSQPEGMSYAQIVQRCAAAVKSGVQNVVLDIDSPGGTLAGAAGFMSEMIRLQEETGVRIVAHAADLAASGGYIVMCGSMGGAYAGPTAYIGSIGVYRVYIDSSKAFEQAGLKTVLVSTGPNKGAFTEGTEIEPEQVAEAQREVDKAGEWFVGVVNAARGLGLTLGEKPADGGVLTGPDAVKAGLVDGVTSLRELVESVEGM